MNQIFTLQRVFLLPKRIIGFAGKSLFLFSLILFGNGPFSTLMAQNSSSALFLKDKEITFKKASIEQLFELKSGAKSKLSLSSDKASKAEFDITIMNNMNPGQKSGAVSAIISLGKEEARLLMNRKERNGKLVYWIAILMSQGSEGFKLSQESKDEFILIRTPKTEIVTE
jgi:hypothetical protein